MGKVAAAAVALVLLSGCMLGPDYKRPELAVPDQFRSTPPRAEISPSAADTAWGQQFGGPAQPAADQATTEMGTPA